MSACTYSQFWPVVMGLILLIWIHVLDGFGLLVIFFFLRSIYLLDGVDCVHQRGRFSPIGHPVLQLSFNAVHGEDVDDNKNKRDKKKKVVQLPSPHHLDFRSENKICRESLSRTLSFIHFGYSIVQVYFSILLLSLHHSVVYSTRSSSFITPSLRHLYTRSLIPHRCYIVMAKNNERLSNNSLKVYFPEDGIFVEQHAHPIIHFTTVVPAHTQSSGSKNI